jgi:branched-chain amino acid transport system permease protein
MQHLANGISLGSLYALIAIGYTMVYGILRLINFAHGDIIMLSAYAVFFGVGVFALPWWAAVLISIVITTIIGMGIERAAYRPLRDSPRISILISAIGVSFLIENLGLVLFGGRAKGFYRLDFFTASKEIAGITINTLTFAIPAVTILLLVLLNFLVNHTKVGMAMRATSKDVEATRLMGINVDNIISFTFMIGSALAAIGGIMWGLKYPQIHPLIGIMPGLKCFIAAVVGGIGNMSGAVLGGFLLGIGEIMLVAFLPALAGYRDAFAFIILIIILLLRPTGLLGEKLAEKV